MTLYDRYMAVDWSASNTPKRGKDSIWISKVGRGPSGPALNCATRSEALAEIKDHMRESVRQDKRLLIGFDFAFGYPKGTAALLEVEGWHGLWSFLSTNIQDAKNNRNNRYDFANEINARLQRRLGIDAGPFWGHPHQHRYTALMPKKPTPWPDAVDQFRHVESVTQGAFSVWQLAYTGCVGSQTLLGISALQSLRRDPEFVDAIAIWPFETQFARDLSKPIIFAEIYPSAHDVVPIDGYPKDAAQVVAVTRDLRQWDESGALHQKLAPQSPLSTSKMSAVLSEEGWILGQ